MEWEIFENRGDYGVSDYAQATKAKLEKTTAAYCKDYGSRGADNHGHHKYTGYANTDTVSCDSGTVPGGRFSRAGSFGSQHGPYAETGFQNKGGSFRTSRGGADALDQARRGWSPRPF